MGYEPRIRRNRCPNGTKKSPPRFLVKNDRVFSAHRVREAHEEAVRLAELDDLSALLHDPFTDAILAEQTSDPSLAPELRPGGGTDGR